MNESGLGAAGIAVGLAYLALSVFVILARLPRQDRLNLPPVAWPLWRRTRLPMTLAAVATGAFALASSLLPPGSAVASGTWMAALLGWTGAVVILDAVSRGKRLRELPALQRGLLTALVIVFAAVTLTRALAPALGAAIAIEAQVVFAIAMLVLLENVMRNAEREILWHVSLPGVATGGLALVSLLLYAAVILQHRFSPPLIGARLALLVMVLPLFAAGAMRAIRWRPRRLHLSREAAFYSASLILGGSFMIVLGIVAELVRDYGTGLAGVIEWAIMFAGLLVLAIVASSGSARSRLMVALSRHFAAAPYDYRQEWLRSIATLSADGGVSVAQRAIKALADTADSPSGILLTHDRQAARLRYSEGWNTALEIPAIPAGTDLFRQCCERTVVELDPEGVTAPFWLAVALPDPRASGPLGVVLLGRPRVAQPLHREMAALLTVVAGEISLVMAERQAAEALAVARRFEEAGKRFAFVAHDIKNIANQLGLLLDNSQRHMADPEFQADLIGTVRDSVDKIRAMIRRLDPSAADRAGRLDVGARLRHLLAHRGRVVLDEGDGHSIVAIDPITFDMIVNHLLDNALEAGTAAQTVIVALSHEPGRVTIRVIDQGRGMSAHFVRERLFRPFASTKAAGFGIGAFQTRELILQAGGSLDVESEEAAGTTMTIRLPTVHEPAAERLETAGIDHE
ncbi:MAG: PEP-CTERM system histidine kinase PrsK [Rhodospirillales bacterium]|uniref:XrtA/PEP-CTERM system histidine kinase PrsK n=1 Tax=Acidiphilium sp. PM TaxID=1043206 RepID=UPI000214587F|nr:XrtA/PEP-CTERM system histidine kinase PrsK [Acidiphilium sp. PM]EGO94713.1 Integral membrane sensor signal transduction histidine kinase [Acidiphilium sp. PM]MBU6355095.1 PEP-CTERM system histidine kinase PrsK [Rhodospirillales bacterium]